MYFGYYYSSVLLPLLPRNRYWPYILRFGSEKPIIIDPYSRNWRLTSARELRPVRKRLHCNSVLLPTGEVFICGGVEVNSGDEGFENEENRAVNEGEIYNSIADRWAVTRPASVIRNYHSVALLMPDGRVWTAGSNINNNYSYRSARRFRDNRAYRRYVLEHGHDPPLIPTENGSGDIQVISGHYRELRIEIFEPEYIFADRPTITSSPSEITIGTIDSFKIQVTQAEEITSVAILRAGTSTHAFNSDQRYIGLNFNHTGLNNLEVIPPPIEITIPGYYLLFAIKGNTEELNGSVPSEGRFIKIITNPRIGTNDEKLRLIEKGKKGDDPAIKAVDNFKIDTK